MLGSFALGWALALGAFKGADWVSARHKAAEIAQKAAATVAEGVKAAAKEAGVPAAATAPAAPSARSEAVAATAPQATPAPAVAEAKPAVPESELKPTVTEVETPSKAEAPPVAKAEDERALTRKLFERNMETVRILSGR